MESALNLFMCGLCNYVVAPYPLQCTQCHVLYCESCIGALLQWSCQQQNCRTSLPPEPMHRGLKEILQKMFFNCPGCKVRYNYENVFDHVQKCDKVPSSCRQT